MDQNNKEVRKNYTPEQKFKIIKDHFVHKIPVSEVLKKHGISSANFYRWQDDFLREPLIE